MGLVHRLVQPDRPDRDHRRDRLRRRGLHRRAAQSALAGTFKGTQHEIIYVYAVILALHAMMNIFSVRLVAFLNDVSVWWHVVGVVVIVGFLILKPAHHQSFSTVFGHTVNNSGFSHGWLWFVLLLGLLQAQYTFTGYDASAHMSEETQNASRSAARGVIMSIVVSAVFGYILALGVTFAIQDLGDDRGGRAASPSSRCSSTRSARRPPR